MKPFGWAALSAFPLLAAFAAFAAIAGLAAFGSWRWGQATRVLVARLDAAREVPTAVRYDARETLGLPEPVRRYFRAVLTDGQPMILTADFEHVGTFDMGEAVASWKPFTSRQRVTTSPPGFVWDGRIALLPGVPAHVHDAYVAGEGLLRPSILGLYAMGGLQGGGPIAQGELLRFFAEAPWYPTSLLPSQGIAWRAVDESSATATLTDGALAATVLVRFGEDGLIASMSAEGRGRAMVGGVMTMTPWEGRLSGYRTVDGMRAPFAGEALWRRPKGDKPYFRATITALAHELAP